MFKKFKNDFKKAVKLKMTLKRLSNFKFKKAVKLFGSS